ncbi:acyl-CoA synthetase FdrA [Bacilliculturomica massiliensis]|uniref:acyl-CoA synthetase FdrA n=1 Tax=Bacilliculturomica massiliensis TaxID=1917867 RepID=UPI001030E2D9|nr:acyl-CoA synthetase FdrA [Bacilliculturomica massiliensis]
MIKTLIKQNFYQDSVKLMLLSRRLSKMEEIENVSAIMATCSNIDILKMAGLYTEEVRKASPDDIVVVVEGKTEKACALAIEEAEREIEGRSPGGEGKDISGEEEESPKSLAAARRRLPGANVTLISVPGKYAFDLADQSLDLGISPMIFSDNVSLEEEISLKKKAEKLGLIVMGPDCGTCVIGGACIGFGNKVKQGNIGIAGASGTGIQQLLCLLYNGGGGVSQAIGTGGRDLHKEVGGISMLAAVDLLEEDEDTRVLVLISKPADPEVEKKILQRVRSGKKPAVICFLGSGPRPEEADGQLCFEPTLEEAAWRALQLAGIRLQPGRSYIRGLYTGGTLAYEALYLMKQKLPEVYSNIPMEGIGKLTDSMVGEKNSVVDLGDDEFTKGRAHPMIDPGLRNSLILREALAEGTGVLMLDFMLGYGCNGDPAGEAAESLRAARKKAEEMGKSIRLLGHVCGTELDQQDLRKQEATLRELGVETYSSNAAMVRAAIEYGKREV